MLGKDTVDSNDLLFPAVDRDYLAQHGQPGRTGAVENAIRAFIDTGVQPPKLPDPINLFLNVGLKTDEDSLVPGPLRSRPGDHVTFRVVIDANLRGRNDRKGCRALGRRRINATQGTRTQLAGLTPRAPSAQALHRAEVRLMFGATDSRTASSRSIDSHLPVGTRS